MDISPSPLTASAFPFVHFKTGVAGDMTRSLTELATLPEDTTSVPSTYKRQSTTAVTPILGYLMSFSGLLDHLHPYNIHIKNKQKTGQWGQVRK